MIVYSCIGLRGCETANRGRESALRALAACLLAAAAIPIGALPQARPFPSIVDLQKIHISAHTGEKPQSKVWTHGGYWWTVLPTSTGTHIFRLDGTAWASVLRVSAATDIHADAKAVGNVAHILLYAGQSSQLVSVEYAPASRTYRMWAARPSAAAIGLEPGVETATIDTDSRGRMWLASDATTDINVRYADSPYSSWSGPITLASGVGTDDICVVTTMNTGAVGVLWSNQNSRRFGFRLHADGADPSAWSADEAPAWQSALPVGQGMADDHLNVAVSSKGMLYAAVKTSYDTPGYAQIALLIRRPSGTWDDLYEVSKTGTRPIAVLDEAAGAIMVVYTSNNGSGNIIYRRSGSPSISFGPVQTLMRGGLNNSTSTKQNYRGSIVLMAADVAKLEAVSVLASTR